MVRRKGVRRRAVTGTVRTEVPNRTAGTSRNRVPLRPPPVATASAKMVDDEIEYLFSQILKKKELPKRF